jgi:glucose/arabinose dehydrogenase
MPRSPLSQRSLDRLRRAAALRNLFPMLKHILRVALLLIIVLGLIGYWATRPSPSRLSTAELSGRVPILSRPNPQTVPTIVIADAVGWAAGAAPRAPAGYRVQRFAEGLDHPRQMLVLPNGDVLVAESRAPASRDDGGLEGRVASWLMGRAGATGTSANRITLLRDADGDGVAEIRRPYITQGLNSPYGMALMDGTLYVANTDAVVAYPYDPDAQSITTAPRRIVDLPANGSNSHWTRSMVAGPEGRLYVGVGSTSNIAEHGLAADAQRARVYEVRPTQNYRRTFASGLRNPSGLALHPQTGDIWAAVNERDMLGSDMVPDYVTRVGFGEFYGWPWYYWGGFVDARVEEQPPQDLSSYTARPDYAVGAHVAPLGLSFATSDALGGPFTNGLFVALHGSWNRSPAAGYEVIFIPFTERNRPADALPIRILTGFLNAEGEAQGRPADARQGRDGGLLVADDVGNIVWRVSRVADAR